MTNENKGSALGNPKWWRPLLLMNQCLGLWWLGWFPLSTHYRAIRLLPTAPDPSRGVARVKHTGGQSKALDFASVAGSGIAGTAALDAAAPKAAAAKAEPATEVFLSCRAWQLRPSGDRVIYCPCTARGPTFWKGDKHLGPFNLPAGVAGTGPGSSGLFQLDRYASHGAGGSAEKHPRTDPAGKL